MTYPIDIKLLSAQYRLNLDSDVMWIELLTEMTVEGWLVTVRKEVNKNFLKLPVPRPSDGLSSNLTCRYAKDYR